LYPNSDVIDNPEKLINAWPVDDGGDGEDNDNYNDDDIYNDNDIDNDNDSNGGSSDSGNGNDGAGDGKPKSKSQLLQKAQSIWPNVVPRSTPCVPRSTSWRLSSMGPEITLLKLKKE
ncbi:hypothetical protein BGX26_004304, partial [Mortierella sp. AD094]